MLCVEWDVKHKVNQSIYVYLITGKQFRRDLHTLFSRSSSSAAAAAAQNRADARQRHDQAQTAV